jgi:parvulin-like peptidyl-prolyl isomerase
MKPFQEMREARKMVHGSNKRPGKLGWRRLALGTGVVALAVGGVCWMRHALLPRADAEPVPALTTTDTPAPAPVAPPSSDYASRVVGYVFDNDPVTRQDLGEYLIARYAPEKLELLLNLRIMQMACRQKGIDVTAGEVENALAEDLKEVSMNRATFVSTVLTRYKKNLYEWKEDMIRPRLMLTKLCRQEVHVTDREMDEAYESVYGEKVEGRIIIWPLDQEKQAQAEYAAVRDSPEAFEERAKHQHSAGLSSSGGKVKPFGRHTMGPEIDAEVFKLRPGEISTLIKTPLGFTVFKCEGRKPADTTVNPDSVRPQLAQQVVEKQIQIQMQTLFPKLRKDAAPKNFLKDGSVPVVTSTPDPTEVVATYNGSVPVTREELGEFLIARFGTENLELLVNRRIIDRTCQERHIVANDAEVEAGLDEDLKKLNVDRPHFEKEFLHDYGKNLYSYKEDVIRSRLLLSRLYRERVKVTEEDVRQGYEAYYGEKLECRMILWPPDQAKFALTEYAKIRDSEAEFDRKARQQASATLAARGGRLEAPFGRHTLGDENLEREAFKLQPGEITTLIGTPQGNVVLKCDRRIPPDKSVDLEKVRPQLTREILEKKVQIEMQVAFKELRDKAHPRLLLKDPNKREDLAETTEQLLAEEHPPDKGGTR